MEYVQYTDFRNRSKDYFDKVEKGFEYAIIRKGIPIAQITPFLGHTTGWKRDIKRLDLKGKVDTLKLISEERSEK